MITPMKWLILVLVPACSGLAVPSHLADETPATVVDSLRAEPAGKVKLVAANRCYVIQAHVLRPEIHALITAIADAIARGGVGLGPDGECVDEDGADVVGYTYIDRALSLNGDAVTVRGVSAVGSTYYRVEVRRQDEVAMVDVLSTPSMEEAWVSLVGAAAERAGTVGIAFLGPRKIDDIVGLNVRESNRGPTPVSTAR